MASYQMSIDINQPVEKVFAFLDDSHHATEWIDGLESIEALTEGGNRVGAKSKHIYHENGQVIEMIEETLIYEPNKIVKFHGQTDGFELIVQYELEQIPTGTRLYYESESRMKGLLMKLMSPVINHSTNNRVNQDLLRLKELLES